MLSIFSLNRIYHDKKDEINHTVCELTLSSMAECLESIAPHECGFGAREGLWIHSCDEAIQLA